MSALKSKIYAASTLAAVGVGLFLNNKVSTSNSNMALKNLAALEVSAGEMWCDQANETVCTITYSGATGTSKGYLRATLP